MRNSDWFWFIDLTQNHASKEKSFHRATGISFHLSSVWWSLNAWKDGQIVIKSRCSKLLKNMKSDSNNNSRARCVIIWQETKKCRRTSLWIKVVTSNEPLFDYFPKQLVASGAAGRSHGLSQHDTRSLQTFFFFCIPVHKACHFILCYAQRFFWCIDTPTDAT